MNVPDPFPLIVLQPVSDFDHRWVALLLEADAPLNGAVLAHLLVDLRLAETLDCLACVAWVDPLAIDPALAAEIPAAHVVLRFPLAAAVDPASQASLAALHAAGFRLMATGLPGQDSALFPGISALAITCPGHAMPAGFGEWLRKLPGPHLALGTTENVCPGFCKFHWLAGHLAGQVSSVTKGSPTTRGLLLKLLSLVTADADTAEIEAVIKRDPNLSYQLLKLVNSVAFAHSGKITNFTQAIALLGRRQLQRWLQLLLYARAQGSETASPLLPRAALRASLMEALAKRLRLTREQEDRAFMVGMFSLLESLFGLPLTEIVAPLNLAEEIVQALVGGTGALGGLLAVVTASEGGPSTALAQALAAAGIDNAGWAAALIEAACWTVQVSKEA